MTPHLVLFILGALASLVSVSAVSLSLKVTGPAQIDDISGLHIKATLKNTGSSALTLVNDPRSVLSRHPTETFAISHESGGYPAFTGIRVRYSFDSAVKNGAVTTLNPGQSIDVTHSLAGAYNFTNPGPGSYEISPSTLFHAVSEAGNPQPIYASLENSHKVAISGTGRLALPPRLRRRREASSTDTAIFRNCNESQETQLNDAISAAISYVDDANSYLGEHTTSSERFTTWFGSFTNRRRNTVLITFHSITTPGSFTSWTYDCECEAGDDFYAIVVPDEYGIINLCPLFWNVPTRGANSQGGTLVHEATHFDDTAGTKDYAYSQDECRDLAEGDPRRATRNAESYTQFAVNDPPLP